MYDWASIQRGLIGHRTFVVTAESPFGFSDQDFNDSKAYFELFERFRKCYLNPVVVLKRLPRSHFNIGNTGNKVKGVMKRRFSRRVMRPFTGTSQPRTRLEENDGYNDFDCGGVRSLSSVLCNSSTKRLPEEMEGTGEGKNTAAKEIAIKTDCCREQQATAIHHPMNHEISLSSGCAELSDDVDERTDRLPSKPNGSLLDDRTNVFKTRTASDGLESFSSIRKSLTPKIYEYSENLDGISSSRFSSENLLDRVKTSPKSVACKAKLTKTSAENAFQPLKNEVIHSSRFVELTVDNKADFVGGISSRLSSSEISSLGETNGIKVRRTSTGLGSSNCIEETQTSYSVKRDVGITVTAEMTVDQPVTAQAQNSIACMAKLLRTTSEILPFPTNPKGELGKTKNDTKIHLELTRNTSLSSEDDMIRLSKFIEQKKSKHELADKLSSPPKLPCTSDGECETSRIIVGTNTCADFYIESQCPESTNRPDSFQSEKSIETRNSCPVPNSPIFNTKKYNLVKSTCTFLNPRKIRTLKPITRETSKDDSSRKRESESISPEEPMKLHHPRVEKMWTILKPCVVKLERMHDLDNLVKKNSMNIFGMRMVYKYRHVKSTRTVSPKSTSARLRTDNARFDERSADDESVASSVDNDESTHQIAQKKIDLSDGLALKKFCQLESVVIEDSDTDQEVEDHIKQLLPPIQCDKQPSHIAICSASTVPAVRESLGDINPVESLHESDLLQHEPFEIEKERLCDSIWSDILDFREPDESEIEDVSAFREKLSDPLPLINHNSIPPVNYRHSERLLEGGSITDALIKESNRRSLDTVDLEPEINSDSEEHVKQLCRDVLNRSPDKSNALNGSIHNTLNSESSSPSAESNPPGCSKTPPKIRLKLARKRRRTAKDDVSYIYSCVENSELVNLPEYKSLPRRPFKRLKFADKNVSNTIMDNDWTPPVNVDDSSTQLIKVENSDQHDMVDGKVDDSVGKVSNTRACKVSTSANPYKELSTIPYILKCNFQNRCRKCKNLKPCANANKKFKLFFSLNVGTGRKLSKPLLDALRNKEDPCVIDRTAAYIAASAVLPQPCTVLVPAAPELIQILLPPQFSKIIMQLLTENNQMEEKVRKSIQASTFAEALDVKRAIIAMKTKSPSNLENDSIQPANFHQMLPERMFLQCQSSEIIATKSNIGNKIRLLRKSMLPVMPKDSKVVLYPSVEAAKARQFGEIIDISESESYAALKEVSSRQEKNLVEHEGKDDLSLSDLSEITSSNGIKSTVDEMSPRLDSSTSQRILSSCDVGQPSSPQNKVGRSSPLKRTVSSVEADSGKNKNMDESVEREPTSNVRESLSGCLSVEPADRRILNSSSPEPFKECVDYKNNSDSRLGNVSLKSQELLESSALVSINLSEMFERSVGRVLHKNANEILKESVLDNPSSASINESIDTAMVTSKDSEQQNVSSKCSNFEFTQTETGDLIIPFDIMPNPARMQEHNNVSSNSGSGDLLQTTPPAVTLPSKVVDDVPLESQVPPAHSSAQKEQNSPASQKTIDETPDVILVPDKFESIDLTACEEESQLISKESSIDLTGIRKTLSIIKNSPISREPYPEWSVICSSLPELGYIRVRKVCSRLMIYDTSVVSEPLGFQNIHELNRFLNSRLANLSYSYRKKIALEWILVTSGYLKVKTIPPTNPQFWRHPSTAAETHKTMREFHKQLNISKIEATKRLNASQNKTSSPVIVSTCSVGKKAKKRVSKPTPQKPATAKATVAKEQFSKDGKAVRINGQLVAMGTPVAYSKSPINSNTEVKDATAPSLSNSIVVSVTPSPVSATAVITSVSLASKRALVNPALKTFETSATPSGLTASTDEFKTTKDSNSSFGDSIPVQRSTNKITSVSTEGMKLLASSPKKALETIPATPSPVPSAPPVTVASTEYVPVTTGSLGKSVPPSSVGSSIVSISCSEPSRLTSVGIKKPSVAPMVRANGISYTSLVPVVISSAGSKTVLPTASVSLATSTGLMTINPTSQTSPSYRHIVMKPGSVNCIVLATTVAAPNNALLASTSLEKRTVNTVTTSAKGTLVGTRPTRVATITSAKTGTATSFLVQSHNVPPPNTLQIRTNSPGVRSNHRPILILRKGAPVQAEPPSKNVIKSLLRNK